MNHDTSTIVDSVVRLLMEPLRILWWDGFRTGVLMALVVVVACLIIGRVRRSPS